MLDVCSHFSQILQFQKEKFRNQLRTQLIIIIIQEFFIQNITMNSSILSISDAMQKTDFVSILNIYLMTYDFVFFLH